MSLPRIRHALGLAALLVGCAAPAASAAPLRMTFTDPVDAPQVGVDLTAGSFEQDVVSGKLTAHIEYAGTLPEGVPTAVRILTGAVALDGDCSATEAKSILVLARLDTDSVIWGLNVPPDQWGTTGTSTRGPQSIDIVLPGNPAFAVRSATCAVIDAGPVESWPDYYLDSDDRVLATLTLAPTVVGGQTGSSPTRDGDSDGRADIVDACPTTPGTGPDGCPLSTDPVALRLGARRLVVDRAMTKAAGTNSCPTKVKVIVKQRGHRLGAGKLPVTESGGQCSVKGILPLKRHRKRSPVYVELSAPGLTTALERIRT